MSFTIHRFLVDNDLGVESVDEFKLFIVPTYTAKLDLHEAVHKLTILLETKEFPFPHIVNQIGG